MAGQGSGGILEVEGLRNNGGAKSQAVHHPVHGLERLALPTEPSGSTAKGAFLKHEFTGRVDGPVMSLPWPAESFGQFDEALVQRQIVAHRVLPSLVRPSEEGEPGLQELIDLAQGEPLGRGTLYSHYDQSDVRIRGFLRPPQPTVGLLHFGQGGVFHRRRLLAGQGRF